MLKELPVMMEASTSNLNPFELKKTFTAWEQWGWWR